MKSKLVLIVLILYSTAGVLSASAAELLQRNTEHFKFIYKESETGAVDELLFFAEDIYDKVAGYFGVYPDNIKVVVTNDMDTANGYFSPVPPQITIFVTSPKSPWLGAGNENWLKYVFTHELTHYVHITWPEGIYHNISKIFGPAALSWRAGGVPGWALEGITTNLETEFTDGGRGRNPFFELYYKAPIIENSMFSLEEAGFSSPYPPSGRIYVAGYIIVNYMMEHFGKDVFARVVRKQNKELMSFEDAVKEETGESLENIFAEMKIELTRQYADDLKLNRGKIISPRKNGYNYSFPKQIGDKWYSYRFNADSIPAIVSFSEDPDKPKYPENEETVIETSLPTRDSYCISSDGRYIYFAAARSKAGLPGISETETDLCCFDTETGKKEILLKDLSVYDLALSPDGGYIAAAQSYASYSRLILINTETLTVTKVFEEPQTAVFTPVFAENGREIFFSASLRGMQDLYKTELLSGKTLPLFAADHAGDYNPVIGDDGSVYFCREDDGRLKLFRFSEDSGVLECIAEDSVGILKGRPVDGSIVYESYSAQGFCVKVMDEPASSFFTAEITSGQIPPAYNFDVQETEHQAGQSFLNLPLPVLWLPIASMSPRPASIAFGAGITAAGCSLSSSYLDFESAWSAAAAFYPEDLRPELELVTLFKAGPGNVYGSLSHEYSGELTSDYSSLYTEKTAVTGAYFLPFIAEHQFSRSIYLTANSAFSYELSRSSDSGFGPGDSGNGITAADGLTAAVGMYFSYVKDASALSGLSPLRGELSAEYLFEPYNINADTEYASQAVLAGSFRFPLFRDIFLLETEFSGSYSTAPCSFSAAAGPYGYAEIPDGPDDGILSAGVNILVSVTGGMYMFLSTQKKADFSIISPSFDIDEYTYYSYGMGLDASALSIKAGLTVPALEEYYLFEPEQGSMFIKLNMDGAFLFQGLQLILD